MGNFQLAVIFRIDNIDVFEKVCSQEQSYFQLFIDHNFIYNMLQYQFNDI